MTPTDQQPAVSRQARTRAKLTQIAKEIEFIERVEVHSENYISMLRFEMLTADQRKAILGRMEDRACTAFELREHEEFLHRYGEEPTRAELVNEWTALSDEARWEIHDEFYERCAIGTADAMYFYPLLMWPERYLS